MTQLVSASAGPQLQRNEVLDVSPPFEVELWGVSVPAVEVRFRRRENGPEEVAIGMDGGALASVLEYKEGRKGVNRIINRNKERFERWSLLWNPEAHSNPFEKQRTYVYGPGLDLFTMLSGQPKAIEFQDWLIERSHELRTKGFTGATPEITQAIEKAVTPTTIAARIDPLDALEQMLTAAREQQRQTLALAAEQKAIAQEQEAVKAKTSELDGRTDDLAKRLARIERERTVDQFKPGEMSLTSLARRARWYSAASEGSKPYPDGVLLAMLNNGFNDRGLLRRINTSVETGEGFRPVYQWVVTPEGVEEFLVETNRLYQPGAFIISPNGAARRAGKHKAARIIKARG